MVRRREVVLVVGAVLVPLLLGTSSCTDTQDQPQDKYAVLDGWYYTRDALRSVSPLVVIDETGEVKICIQLPSGEDASLRSQIEGAAESAVSRWNGFLNEPPPPDQGEFRFPPWAVGSVVVSFTCTGRPLYTIVADYGNDRAYADVLDRHIFLDNNILTGRWQLEPVIAHEYGHLMGLADTYYEPGNGLDVQGQPDSMMQTATTFTEDDRAAVWNLWRYLVYGGNPCGPGYGVQADREFQTYCIIGGEGVGGGSWDDRGGEDDGGGWDDGGGEDDGGGWDDGGCDHSCSEFALGSGDCVEDTNGHFWQCSSDGCLYGVAECSAIGGDSAADSGGCSAYCSDYGVGAGECFMDEIGYWECGDDGCIYNVASCGGGGDLPADSGGCSAYCSDYGVGSGGCFMDESGYAWECRDDGCIYSVASCGGGGDLAADSGGCSAYCSDYGVGSGGCFMDESSYAWECRDDGCIYNVASCVGGATGEFGGCDFYCSDYGAYEGQCWGDGAGYSWLCDLDGCVYLVDYC